MFQRVEDIRAKGYRAAVRSMVAKVGITFTVKRKSGTDASSRVYGVDEGGTDSYPVSHTIRGVLLTYDLVPVDNTSIGSFQEGYLYTDNDDVQAGDILELERDDGAVKLYKVEADEQIGQTTEVVQRWHVSSIAM